jgi:hypothetical protein
MRDAIMLHPHGNWPYMGDVLFLAKNYPNVHLDLCWVHMIDPLYSRELLKRAVTTVSHTKIFGFGGDYFLSPGHSVAHLALAREVIASALTDLIESVWLEESIGVTGVRTMFAVQVDGYFTQVPGVFHTGTPSAEQREMYSVAYVGYQAGIEAAHPGNTIGDVAKAELAVLENSGWLKWHAYDLGHGDGLDHPEIPAVTPESNVPIEPGMMLCIHPGLRKPGIGGAFVGGTVMIGEDGAIPLHQVASEI